MSDKLFKVTVVTQANTSVEYNLGNFFIDVLEVLRARPQTIITLNCNYDPENMTEIF